MSQSPIRILIVDDNKLMRQGYKSIIELEDDICVLGTAEDGEEAIKKARELQPDVILMNHGMPGIDGSTATRLILAEFPSIKIIVNSASCHYIKKYALASGAKAVMYSTANPEHIIDMVRDVYYNRIDDSIPMIRLLLVEDHSLRRDALRTWLEDIDDIVIVGMVEDGHDALKAVRQFQPDVILMNYMMPHMDGITASAEILAEFPDAKILIHSIIRNEILLQAWEVGAKGVLRVGKELDNWLGTIRNVYHERYRRNSWVMISPSLSESPTDTRLD